MSHDEKSLKLRVDEMLPAEERRQYSDEEISLLYELARTYLESGSLSQADAVLSGVLAVSPGHALSWLAMGYVKSLREAEDEAIFCCRQSLRSDPELAEATLLLATLLMNSGDFQSAGTLLGEIGDRIEAGQIRRSEIVRLFKMQLARFDQRAKRG